MPIKYYRKSVYGRTLLYFVERKQAKDFKKVARRYTLRTRDIDILEKFGVEFEEVSAKDLD